MHNQQAAHKNAARSEQDRHVRTSDDFPIREYMGAMAAELAQMARWDGDEELGRLLDAAAERAGRPPAG